MILGFPKKSILSITVASFLVAGTLCQAEETNSAGSTITKAAVDVGLKLVGYGIEQLIGEKKEDPQLKELIEETKDINKKINLTNTELKHIHNSIVEIIDQMKEGKHKEKAEKITKTYSELDTIWTIFLNNVGELTREEILKDKHSLEKLYENIYKTEILKNLSERSADLSGVTSAKSDIDTYGAFLSTVVEYRNQIIKLEKGKEGTDAIKEIEKFNEYILSTYINTSLRLKRIYLIESLGVYLQANAGSMAGNENRNNYTGLTIAENEVSIHNKYDKNMAALNEIYKIKFDKLKNEIKKNGVIISDDNDDYMSAKEYLKEKLPEGDWKEKATLYAWKGVFDEKEESIMGSYNGQELEVYVKSIDSFRSININNCYNNSGIIVTSTYDPRLECEYLDTSKFMSVLSTDKIFGYTTWSEGSRSTGQGYSLAEQKVIYNKDRISIEGNSKRAIDKEGKLYFEPHHRENRIIQYNFTNGEKALFQFSTTHHKKFAMKGHTHIGVGCGKAKDTADWSCSEEKSNNRGIAGGGHSALVLTSKSGEKARIFIGGRGSENKSNVSERHAYMDTCIKDFSNCSKEGVRQ